MATPALPRCLSNPSSNTGQNPLLTLTLSPSAAGSQNIEEEARPLFDVLLADCCREFEQGHSPWAAHWKEAAWRLRRVELQVEAERACRWRQKVEEIEAKVTALREEQAAALERIDAEFKEQLRLLWRDAIAKELKLQEQWAVKHASLSRGLEQLGSRRRR
ncbi:Transcription factor AS1 [Platanthera guangdongensis]|uniref:Transcription factor AS1 n=1 Tax=Platanthera guangdongensis TaxID=2320717 RepID=A0ABR2MQI5_9ASPA